MNKCGGDDHRSLCLLIAYSHFSLLILYHHLSTRFGNYYKKIETKTKRAQAKEQASALTAITSCTADPACQQQQNASFANEQSARWPPAARQRITPRPPPPERQAASRTSRTRRRQTKKWCWRHRRAPTTRRHRQRTLRRSRRDEASASSCVQSRRGTTRPNSCC